MAAHGLYALIVSDLAVFDEHFRQAAYAACTRWDYPPPSLDWFGAAHARLPVGLRIEVGRAVRAGAIDTVDGFHFVVTAADSGPFSWFLDDRERRHPVPNWEYFVQVAEYARVLSLTADHDDLRVGFEDSHMDISVRRGTDLLWWIDAEETFVDMFDLSRNLDRIGVGGIDHDADERHDAALRKAKLVVELRPAYLSLVGVGGRLDFSIAVHDIHHFDLIPDLVPVGARL